MDGIVTNSNLETQQTQTSETSTTVTEQSTETTPEKVSTLQKFIDGLFCGKKTPESDSAEEPKENSKEDSTKDSETKPESKPESKPFTEEDVNKAIETAKQKWLEEQTEAERIKTLSPEEKAKEEQKSKDAELTDLKNQILQRDLKDTAIAELDKEGFPVKLAENLNYSSKEKMEESLKSTMEVFKESLKTAINIKLKGKTPEGLGGAATAENMIKDQIAKNIRGGMM